MNGASDRQFPGAHLMIRAYANLRLAAKLAIPLALLAAVTTFIVWQARSALQIMGADTQEIVDIAAPRRAFSLTMLNAINAASNSEKNVILADDKAEKTGHEKQFHERM